MFPAESVGKSYLITRSPIRSTGTYHEPDIVEQHRTEVVILTPTSCTTYWVVLEGVHATSGDEPFGVVAYGAGSAGSYAFAGGADVKKISEPPIVY